MSVRGIGQLLAEHPFFAGLDDDVLALLVGCATDVANRYYGTERYAAKDVKEVELLQHRPSREFVVIADFQSRGDSPEAMRKRAAEIGADSAIAVVAHRMRRIVRKRR